MYEKYEEKNPLLCQSTTIKAWLIFNDVTTLQRFIWNRRSCNTVFPIISQLNITFAKKTKQPLYAEFVTPYFFIHVFYGLVSVLKCLLLFNFVLLAKPFCILP